MAMGDYGFPGDVSVARQNRLRDTYMGCAPCAAKLGSAVPSGNYMGAIGKVVGMRGLQGVTSTSRAQQELAQLGVGRSPSVAAIGVRGLGDGTRDRAMCQASFQAGQAGVGVAQGYHTQSAGQNTPDQGWTTALGISNAVMTVGGALCNFIDTGAGPTAPNGTPYAPQTLYNAPPPSTPQQPNWLLIGGVGVGALVVGYLLFAK